MFYVDLEGDVESEAFRPVLDELHKKIDYFKILGAY